MRSAAVSAAILGKLGGNSKEIGLYARAALSRRDGGATHEAFTLFASKTARQGISGVLRTAVA
jgi:hypothetical protein